MHPSASRSWSRALGKAGWFACLAAVSCHPVQAAAVKSVSADAFRGEIAGLRQLADACAADPKACDRGKVPETQKIEGAPGGSFQISWGWLAETLVSAGRASPGDRAKAMQAVSLHLRTLETEAEGAGQAGTPPAAFRSARTAATAALARDEFRASIEGPGWLDRQLARLQDAILALFTGMGRLGQRAPWLAPLVEWSCFGLAAAGLLWFVRGSLARGALRLSLSEGASPVSHGEHDAADWARLAEEHAAARDWREAVHSLYWAAISLLEGRRAWKPNATRTPREYLRLLRPGSEAQGLLRELTRQFERVWYGHAEAQESQYRVALGSYRALEAAKPERLPQASGTATPPTATGGS